MQKQKLILRKVVSKAMVMTFAISRVLMGVAAINTTGVPAREYLKIITLDVVSDATLSEALQAERLTVSSFKSGGYDKLVKSGAGTLFMTEDIQAFTGDIFVEAGTLAVAHKDGLGKRTTDSFVVVRSGATLRWTAATTYSAKLIYFEGNGYGENSGALVAEDVNNTGSFWQNEVFVMTGNATVRALYDGKTPSLLRSSEIYMNGYTNTCWFGAKGKQFSFGPKVKDGGVFDIRLGYLYLDQTIELPVDSFGASRIVLASRDCQINFQNASYDSAFWPICVNLSPSAFKVSADSEWPAALEIAAGAVVTMTDNHRLSFVGGLKGSGKFTVSAGTLALGEANDEFDGELAMSGGSLELPSECLVRPGLVAGYSSDLMPGGYAIDGEWKNTTDMPTLTNAIETTEMIRLGNAGVEIEGQTTSKQVYTYSGYIMNTSDVAQTWAFLCNMKHYVDLRVGDVSSTMFSNWKKYDEVRAARATLQPGANEFILKCYVNASKGGRASLKDMVGKTYPAFGVIRNVDPAKDLSTSLATDWEQIIGDDGDGNLFRVAVNTSEVSELMRIGLLPRKTESISNLAMSNGATLWTEGTTLAVSNLTGVGFVAQTDGSIEGNVFAISGDWIIPSEKLISGVRLESEIAVMFGDNARIVIDHFGVPRGEWLEVLTSSVEVRGVPSVVFSDGRNRSVETRLSPDGKTLSLRVGTSGVRLIVR